MTTINIKYQLVPPSNHIANNVEISIQTFKKNFIAVLCSVDKYFHLQLWDRILQQATISLNFLRKSRTLPHLSAYAHIFGGFDFNRTPLAPPRKRIVIHNRPNDRASWATHGEDGWYIGPSLEHYRYHQEYIPKTRAENIRHSIVFPKTIQRATDVFHRCNYSCRTGFN